jgi:hypothetical protein
MHVFVDAKMPSRLVVTNAYQRYASEPQQVAPPWRLTPRPPLPLAPHLQCLDAVHVDIHVMLGSYQHCSIRAHGPDHVCAAGAQAAGRGTCSRHGSRQHVVWRVVQGGALCSGCAQMQRHDLSCSHNSMLIM